MYKILILILSFSLSSVMAQTHTNRGGSGPDSEQVGSCTQLQASARNMQKSYLKHFPVKKKKGEMVEIEKDFEKLIRSQNLLIDLQLTGDFKMPICKTCLNEPKQILVDLVELYERGQHCPEFWKSQQDLVPLIKNIIVYGK